MFETYLALQAACLLVLIARHRNVPGYCLWFIPIISIALTHELLAEYAFDKQYYSTRIYQPIECLLLLLFYNNILKERKNKRFLPLVYVAYLVAVLCYYSFYTKNFNVLDYMDFVLEAMIICILVVLFLSETLNYKGELSLFGYPAFWLNAVHLIFYGGCFFSMGAYQAINDSQHELAEIARDIPRYLNLLLYAVYFIVFLTARTEKS